MFCSETESGVSRALFHPEIASESNFDLGLTVLFLQQRALLDIISSFDRTILMIFNLCRL